jgi:hypothetical protein
MDGAQEKTAPHRSGPDAAPDAGPDIAPDARPDAAPGRSSAPAWAGHLDATRLPGFPAAHAAPIAPAADVRLGPPAWSVPASWPGSVAGTGGPPRSRRGGRAPWLVAGVVAVVVGLVAAVLVWAPWQPPSTPRNVATAGTSATTVDLTWSPRVEGTGVGSYVIERDGTDVRSVPETSTSFRDEGLLPGSTHRYRLIAARGAKRSPASTPLVVTLPAPSPVGLTRETVDQHSATVAWTAPGGVPVPDQYVIIVNGQSNDVVGSSGGPQESARILRLDPGTTYSVQVQASWDGGGVSPASPVLSVTTADPPLSEARLDGGSARVAFRVTESSASNIRVGSAFTGTWTLTPTCSSGPCDVRLVANFHPSGRGVPFGLTLTRRGATYTGSTTAAISQCRGRPTPDAVSVTLTVVSAQGTDWVATRWAGRIEYRNPYTNAGGGYYCPSGRTAASISWTGAGTGTGAVT